MRRSCSINRIRPADKKEPVVIKKYANRRLYNTETSTYVTLDDLAAMVKSERDFVVFDAKTGDDLTHSVLTQIIVDQESRMGTQTLLPIPFLRQLIRFYGDSIERLVPSYLQVSLETLAKEQERFRKQFAGAFTPAGAFEAYQEQARKNLAMFEQAMAMFSPFRAAKVAAQAGRGSRRSRGRQGWRQARRARPTSSPSSRPQLAEHPVEAREALRRPRVKPLPLLSAADAGASSVRADRQVAAGDANADREAGNDVDQRADQMKKNTDVAAAFDHQELDDAGDEHQHRQPVIDQRDGRRVGRFHQLGEQHSMVTRMIRSPHVNVHWRPLDHRRWLNSGALKEPVAGSPPANIDEDVVENERNGDQRQGPERHQSSHAAAVNRVSPDIIDHAGRGGNWATSTPACSSALSQTSALGARI